VIHHVDFVVSDINRSEQFYAPTLAILGLKLVYRNKPNRLGGETLGFGAHADPFFYVRSGQPAVGYLHVAFLAGTRKQVDDFHATAIQNGGRDNGSPGFRLQYAKYYYAAFVFDPDGNNIEAVCRAESDLQS
jgi:catechol 2,3-dioxygenase-like lactoylglutathione lyase family enzyme